MIEAIQQQVPCVLTRVKLIDLGFMLCGMKYSRITSSWQVIKTHLDGSLTQDDPLFPESFQ